jgi:hypothetical protein
METTLFDLYYILVTRFYNYPQRQSSGILHASYHLIPTHFVSLRKGNHHTKPHFLNYRLITTQEGKVCVGKKLPTLNYYVNTTNYKKIPNMYNNNMRAKKNTINKSRITSAPHPKFYKLLYAF